MPMLTVPVSGATPDEIAEAYAWTEPLRGRDLACWCGLCPAHQDGLPLRVACPDCAPCHADVLLELANA
jgi:hypothetical protein